MRYWEPNENRPNYGAEKLYTGEIEYGKIFDLIAVFIETNEVFVFAYLFITVQLCKYFYL